MHGLTSGPATIHGFVRSAMMLAACILAVALVLLPVRDRGNTAPAVLGLVRCGRDLLVLRR